MLVSSLMDDSEKYLSVYQHQNCLRLIDWGKWTDKNKDDNCIPKLVNKVNKIATHASKANEFFKKYLEEKLTAKDYRLLKGVFWDQDLDNDELEIIFNYRRETYDESDEVSIASVQHLPATHWDHEALHNN